MSKTPPPNKFGQIVSRTLPHPCPQSRSGTRSAAIPLLKLMTFRKVLTNKIEIINHCSLVSRSFLLIDGGIIDGISRRNKNVAESSNTNPHAFNGSLCLDNKPTKFRQYIFTGLFYRQFRQFENPVKRC